MLSVQITAKLPAWLDTTEVVEHVLLLRDFEWACYLLSLPHSHSLIYRSPLSQTQQHEHIHAHAAALISLSTMATCKQTSKFLHTHGPLFQEPSPCFTANHNASPLCNDQSRDHSGGHSVSFNVHRPSVRNNKILQESLSKYLLLVFLRHVGVRAALCNVGRLLYLKLVNVRH